MEYCTCCFGDILNLLIAKICKDCGCSYLIWGRVNYCKYYLSWLLHLNSNEPSVEGD